LPEKPSRVRLQLAHELQAARTLSGLEQKPLGQRIGITQSMVSRAENGRRLLDRAKIEAWLRETGVGEDVRSRTLALAEAAHSETRPWRALLEDDTHLQEEAARRNAAARLVQNFQPTVLPGLLQTADYARAIIPLADITGTMDHRAALAARIERQGVIREPGRRFAFLIAERLLRWEPAPGTLAPQLAQLRAALDLDAVELGVLPDGYAGALPWHNFVLRYPVDEDEPPYVALELIHGEEKITDEDAVQAYRGLWSRLWDAAVTGDDAAALLADAGA
jgi:transcriptional regulator with XRE-family HTH domain